MNKPWILFEAGAIASKLGTSNLTPLLIDLSPSDLDNPLSKLQATKVEKDDFYKLIKTINDAVENRDLDDARLRMSFEMWWGKLQEKIDAAKARADKAGENIKEVPLRTDREIFEETLEIVRQISQSLQNRLYSETIKTTLGDLARIPSYIESRINPIYTPTYRYKISIDNFDLDKYNKFLDLVMERSGIIWKGVSLDNKTIDLVLARDLSFNLLDVLADEAGLDATEIREA